MQFFKKLSKIQNIWNMVLDDPIFLTIRIYSLIYKFFLKLRKNVIIGNNLNLKGIPIIQTMNGGRIILGNNITLYSTNRQYFGHMSSKVRLLADKPGAIIEIKDNSRINGATIHACKKISIGKNCLIAANTSIIDSDGHDLCLHNPETRLNTKGVSGEIIIKDCVWIGLNCVITKDVTIGYGSVIGANSVVTKDIPSNSLAVGNPAKIVKQV